MQALQDLEKAEVRGRFQRDDVARLRDGAQAQRDPPGTLFSASDRYRHCIRLGVGGRLDDTQRHALMRVGALARGLLAAAPALPEAA